jgi:hypothetical protein
VSRRRTLLITATAVVAAGAAITAGLLWRPAPSTRAPAAAVGTPADATAETRSPQRQAEDTFIGTTAAHLCNVQSTVYDDTRALADAYQSPPAYSGLTGAQVADFERRLVTDADFAARLTRQLQTACHTTLK